MPTRATQSDAMEVRDLSAALDKLSLDQREVLMLVALEQLNYDEVAEALSIPVETVMSRLSRGRARLRVILEGKEPSGNEQLGNLRVVK